MTYEIDAKKVEAPKTHINAIRNQHSFLYHTGKIDVWGISLYAFGLYPFLNKSLKEINNKIIDLNFFSTQFAYKLNLATSFGSNQLKVENIIKSLISELKVNRNILKRTEIINDFINTENITVSNFCMNYGICQKTFERYVVNITGCTPIKLRKIIKFKKVSSYLLINKHAKISDLVYDNNYTDQSYFSKEFKKISGMSPKKFSEEKITVLENSIFV